MANKIVQLVDKNSNNLYPVAGAVITDAVSTGAISSQAVTNPKIENGAVNGVENNATAIGTAKLALDTVGTPNLRDKSVTSDKIDFATFDTGWVDVALASGWRSTADTLRNKAQVRKIGKQVYMKGLIRPNTAITIEQPQIGTIPEEFRPAYPVVSIQSGSMATYERLEVTPDGAVKFYYKFTNNSGTMKINNSWSSSSESWYSLSASWVIE